MDIIGQYYGFSIDQKGKGIDDRYIRIRYHGAI
jgi:hypothetical protein